MAKQYDEDDMRLTDCCGSHSTYDENGTLYCKTCYAEVEIGQGDGAEYREDNP